MIFYRWYVSAQQDFTKRFSCPENHVLAKIEFKRQKNIERMWWEFECAEVPYKVQCKKKWTPCESNGEENGQRNYVQYIDRHNLDCGDSGFMKAFEFYSCKHNKKGGLKFGYTCCYLDK